jgi:hypothetical protein
MTDPLMVVRSCFTTVTHTASLNNSGMHCALYTLSKAAKNIYLFLVHLTTMSVVQTVQDRMVWEYYLTGSCCGAVRPYIPAFAWRD